MLTVFLQTVQHRCAPAAGAALLPMFVPLVVLAPVAGRLAARFGSRVPLVAGAVVAAFDGAGWARSPADRSGLAGGLNNTARQTGTALGVAIFGSVAAATATPDSFVTGRHVLAVVGAAVWVGVLVLVVRTCR